MNGPDDVNAVGLIWTIRVNYTMPETGNRRILIRGVNWIGDAVLTLPAIEAVRRAFPEARITLLVRPWVAEIFRNSRCVDDIIHYGEEFRGISGKLRLAKALRRGRFDTAILLQNAFDAALIAWLAGIPERIGYDRDHRGSLLTRAVTVSPVTLARHQVHYYLDLLRSAGLPAEVSAPTIFLTDEERKWARDLISSSLPDSRSPLIGINPGATYGSAKRWLPERFADLIGRIINEMGGRAVIFGSKAEAGIAKEITDGTRCRDLMTQGRVLDMSGRTDLRQLAALISECDALISNDSGPMHIAPALNVPVVAVFGSTNWKATGPYGEGHRVITKELPCSPCMKRECPEGHLRCMDEVSVGDVFAALQEVILRDRAVFLDRDGTLIEDKHYLNSFDGLVLYPDAKDALRSLRDAGYKLIGITNQSGIARGIVDERFIVESNAFLQKELGIDDFYYCPHHPDEHCPCRKPEDLNVQKARLRHRIVLRGSYVIGDKELDVLLAKKAGAAGILLSPGSPPENTCADYVARDLTDAAQWIVKRGSRTAS